MQINNSECINCNACADVCEEDAVVLHDGIMEIDESKCTECGDCVDMCPSDCINP